MPKFTTFVILVLLLLIPTAYADEKSEATPEKDAKNSPWLITPLLSSDPKISTAAGALAGYIHKFDEKSPASIIGVAGTYSTLTHGILELLRKSILKKIRSV